VSHQVELIREMSMALGEGPVWLADRRELAFVDIVGGAVHRWSPAKRQLHTIHVDAAPTFVVPAAGAALLVGAGSGIYHLKADGLGRCVAEIDQPRTNRTNDATVDCHGRLWFGTMDENAAEPTGAVWRLDHNGLARTGIAAVITNGPACNPSGTLLYDVDTVARTIFCSKVTEGGKLVDREPFIQIAPADGYPDGVTVDAEGCLWVALWDGWAARRYSPAAELLEEVRFPCARVTKIAFGGDDLQTAYATTARVGLSEDQLQHQPLAGSLFAFDVGVPGIITQPVSI